MLKLLVPVILAFWLSLFLDCASAQTASYKTDAIKLLEHRTSDLDLEIAGDLTGFPPKTVRYIPREELLKLPQVTYTVTDDPNLAAKTEITGVLLTELTKRIVATKPDQMVVAICVDQYHAHYTPEYIRAHQPILVLKINGKAPAEWPKNAVVSSASMEPYLISYGKFVPRFKIRAHQDQPQIPWGVLRLEFRSQQTVLAAIRPQGPHANDAAVRDGFVIAQQNCFRCHDNAGEGGTKSGRPWAVLATWAQASPARFSAYVRTPQAVNPKSRMEPNPQYDDATMQALIEYFKTFLPANKQSPAKSLSPIRQPRIR